MIVPYLRALGSYCIALSKRPWALAAQAPKIGGTEEVLEWFNYHRASAHPGCKLAAWVYQINLHRHFARASSRPTRGWIKLFCARKRFDSYPHCQPSEAFVACSMQISYCRRRTLRTRLLTGMCGTLMLDVMAPEAHQNDCTYVSSVDLLLIH